jgi:hypothetical protein
MILILKFGCTNGLKSIDEYLDVEKKMISKNEDFIHQKKS